MARNQRRSLEWAGRVDEWRRSGLSLPEFCRQRGFKKTTMCGWVYKPALKQAIENARRLDGVPRADATKIRKPATPAPVPAFVPVRLRQLLNSAPTEPASRSAIEIIVGEGRRVVVERGFDAETLRRVVAVLEAGPC